MWQNSHLSHNSCFPGSLTAQFSYLVILLLYYFLVLGHIQKNSGLSGEKIYFFFLIRFSIFPPKTHESGLVAWHHFAPLALASPVLCNNSLLTGAVVSRPNLFSRWQQAELPKNPAWSSLTQHLLASLWYCGVLFGISWWKNQFAM